MIFNIIKLIYFSDVSEYLYSNIERRPINLCIGDIMAIKTFPNKHDNKILFMP